MKIRIKHDEDPVSPRDFDNFGVMVCMHRRYTLGDKHDLKEDLFASWDTIQQYLEREEGALHILPLYLYDHSGIAMSTLREWPFNCPWDSGQVGFIYTTNGIIKKMGVRPEDVEEQLRLEVKTYSQFISGDVHGYIIEDDDGKIVDSCWGFFGYEYAEQEAEEQLRLLLKDKKAIGPN